MKRILLITPMLHQGGFERICVMSARLLQKDFEVFVAVFYTEDFSCNFGIMANMVNVLSFVSKRRI